MHRVCPADRRGCGFGQAEVQHLALGDELSDRGGGLLDGGVRVDPVLVVQVDSIGAKPPQ